MNLSELSDFSGRTVFSNHYGGQNCLMLGPWEISDILFHNPTDNTNRLVECKMLSTDNLERYPNTLVIDRAKVDALLRRSKDLGLASPWLFFCIAFTQGQYLAWQCDCKDLEGRETVQTISQKTMESNDKIVKESYIINKSDCLKIINKK